MSRPVRATHRFVHVEVLKRFASIADPSQGGDRHLVDEGAVTIRDDGSVVAGAEGPAGRACRERRPAAIDVPAHSRLRRWLWVLVRRPGRAPGRRSAEPAVVSADVEGGQHAGIRFEQALEKAPITRVQTGADVGHHTNPFFRKRRPDRVFIRAERDLGRSLRGGATAAWERVSFLDAHDRFVRIGADVVLDTYRSMLARNAVYARGLG